MKAHLQQIVSIMLAMLIIFMAPGGGSKASASGGYGAIPTHALEELFMTENTDQDIELLGHLGGSAGVIEVRGQYAYVAFGPEFAILDISDPAHIQRAGWVLAKGLINDISIDGEYAYIAYGRSGNPTGLQVISIRHPSIPVILTTMEFRFCGSAPKVTINGYYAYFTYQGCDKFSDIIIQPAYSYLYQLDISTPTHPVIINTYSQFINNVVDLAATEAWLYTLWGYPMPMLRIFDISTPGSMVEVATYNIGERYEADLDLSGDFALIADGTDNLEVLDLSDPTQPTAAISYTLPGPAHGIFIDGTTAYLALNDAAVLLLDVANPLNQVPAGSYPTVEPAVDLFVDGTTAYLTNGEGVEIFDTVSLSRSGLSIYPQHPNGNAYAEPYAYTAADNGFWVLDISDPRMPVPVAHLETQFPATSIELRENYAYVALFGSGLWIIDVSNPLSPSVASIFSLPDEIRQIILSESRLYIAAGADGLHVLDLSSPLAPSEIGSYLPPYAINAVAVDGDHVYLATDSGTLPVLDVSNPQAIEVVGLADPSDDYPYCLNAETIAVQANIIYQGGTCSGPTPLAGIHGAIRMFDVSDPENPFEVGDLPNLSTPTWISLGPGRAYIASYHNGLRVFDISDTSAPQMIASYAPPEVPTGVTPAGGYIFLYGNSAFILRYTDPALPSISGSITQANRQPYPGVLVSAGSPVLEKVTDTRGAYSFPGIIDGTYTLTPSLPGHVFTPSLRTVSIPPSRSWQNFTILPEPAEIDFTPGISATLGYTDTQGLPTWLEIPGDASAAPLTFSMVPTMAEGTTDFAFAGHAFDLNVSGIGEVTAGFVFNAPLFVTIQYSQQDISVAPGTDNLVLWWWDGSTWQDAAQSCSPASKYNRDPDNFTLSLSICQTGTYKLMGPTNKVLLPIIHNAEQ